MNILLISPKYDATIVAPHLGLGYLSSTLKKKGQKVKVLDGTREKVVYDPEAWDLFLEMREDMVTPWDNISGYRGFGYDETVDYFAKINWDITSQFKLQFSYWNVASQIWISRNLLFLIAY